MSANDAVKAPVKAMLEAFWVQDLDTARAQLAPDAQWHFAPSLGYPTPAPAADALGWIIRDMFTAFHPDTPLTVEWVHLLADGPEVTAEYIARARTVNDKPYVNRYCLRARVEGGKIVSIRPFTDTRYLTQLLLD